MEEEKIGYLWNGRRWSRGNPWGNYLVLISYCSVIRSRGGMTFEMMIGKELIYPAYPLQPLKISGIGKNRLLIEGEEVGWCKSLE